MTDINGLCGGWDQQFNIFANESILQRSWQRCMTDHGLEQLDSSREEVVTSDELKLTLERERPFFNIARVGLRKLFSRVGDAGFGVLLTDATGLTLDSRLPSEFNDVKGKLTVGARWSESLAGTNGIGTSLAERLPVLIHQDEHFLHQNHSLSCAATPIFDPQGQLKACLNSSCLNASYGREQQLLSLHWVMMHGRLIENNYLYHAYQNHFVVRLFEENEFADGTRDLLLAVGDSGRVVGANLAAFTMFESYERFASLLGCELAQLLGLTLEEMIERSGGGKLTVQLALKGGSQPICARLICGSKKSGTALTQQHPSPSVAPKNTHSDHISLSQIAGSDPVLKHSIARLERVIDCDIPILITGETGTGKEALARAIHATSTRADQAFVALNCAAIPEPLIESELFGYRAGTFTGGRKNGAKGKLELAHGGTLFLDEIGDMPLDLQCRLLRVLAEREVLPLGADRAIKLDVQVISATHQDLPAQIAKSMFRQDLYYRLNGMSMSLPALRERSDFDHVVETVLQCIFRPLDTVRISERAMDVLRGHSWPGNIRQLLNALKYSLAVCDEGFVRLDCLPAELTLLKPTGASVAAVKAPLCQSVDSAESERLRQALEQCGGRIERVARQLGVSRSTVYRKMRKYALKPPA